MRQWFFIASPKKSGTLFTHALIQAAFRSLDIPSDPPYFAPPVSQWYPIIRPNVPGMRTLASNWSQFSSSTAYQYLTPEDKEFHRRIVSENITPLLQKSMSSPEERIEASFARIAYLFSAYPENKPLVTVGPNFLDDIYWLSTFKQFNNVAAALSNYALKPLLVVREPVERLKSRIQMFMENEGHDIAWVIENRKIIVEITRFASRINVLRCLCPVTALNFECFKKDPIVLLRTLEGMMGMKIFDEERLELPTVPNRSRLRIENYLPADVLADMTDELKPESAAFDQLFAEDDIAELPMTDASELRDVLSSQRYVFM